MQDILGETEANSWEGFSGELVYMTAPELAAQQKSYIY